MGFFDNLFGSKSEEETSNGGVPWVSLISSSQLDDLVEQSKSKAQVVFKHSTTCGISGMVLRMFSSSYAAEENADFHLLDLHAHRDISNAITSRFGVMHQSPQLLIIKEGKVVFHTSHGAIADINLQDYL
ncbi:bacillithiol system redox-active protein YtxJ [Muricauda sp. JGD-17]|uniref:Bacillithiol system redox-active protein YtxJ n=1 Tax=Flagellimonas ochracea TaxID=2696472 RepID=A0A964T9I3_9FLAO|nr:bacillithiol system redox-active protein YtxJ [Allomuricauda ochracea]NAY90735.1 bacillithiol system redox-active protein YtxJ [Allomuricauda ochracea]